MTRTVGLWIVMALFVSVLSVPAEACHGCRRGHWDGHNGRVFVAGVVGSAIDTTRCYYPAPTDYAPPPAYYAPAPVCSVPGYSYPTSSYSDGPWQGYCEGQRAGETAMTTYPAGLPSYQYKYFNY